MSKSQTVNPSNIPARMNQAQKEWFILFSIAVAGKSAKQTEKKLNDFLGSIVPDGWAFSGPFAKVESLILQGKLWETLHEFKFGQYKRIHAAFQQVTKLKAPYTVEGLMEIDGIGPKTARFVHLYTNPKADCVPLDTHVLKYLRAKGYESVPTSTPQAGALYGRLEACFKKEATDQGKTVRQLDTEVWNSYANTSKAA